jgi:site-specific recombinase XerD
MQGDEIRALRRLQREQEASPYVFTSERGGPMSAKSFGTLFERLGRRAGMPFTIFPHMLRHACGYALANAGHDTRALQAWLGHKNIQHTVRYTELAPDRFKSGDRATRESTRFRTIQVCPKDLYPPMVS